MAQAGGFHPRKRSEVWKYFQLDESHDNKVKCNLCGAILSHCGGSTGTMSNHLKHKHPSVSMGKDSAGSNSTGQSQLKQASLNAYRAPVMSKDKWKRCTQKIAAMCAIDFRPISIVEGTGFREFLKELNPAYAVPHRSCVSKHIDLLYSEQRDALKALLYNQTGIAITTDLWTSMANEGYITLTCHFVDEKFNLMNFVLATREVETRHTGKNIASEISTILSEYGISQETITAIVTDNAANMDVCARELEMFHVRCFAHTLQLSIRGAFESTPAVQKTIAASKKLVAHFHKSVLATQELHVKQKQNDLPGNRLIIDCPTRWNSTYDMFERLCEQRVAVYAVLHDSKVTKSADAKVLDMTDAQWRIVESMIPVLRPLYMATQVMCSEKYPTLGGIFPVLFGLTTKHLKVHEEDVCPVVTFKQFILAELNFRFGLTDVDSLCDSVAKTSTFLDPRHKLLAFLNDESRERVHAHVLGLMSVAPCPVNVVNVPTEGIDGQSDNVHNNVPLKRRKISNDDLAFLLGDFYQDHKPASPSTSSDELELYIKYSPQPTNEDPFGWWRANTSLFPRLSSLARKYMGVPATSVSSERVFSVAGGTVTKLRSALDPESVDKIVFLNKFLKSFGSGSETIKEQNENQNPSVGLKKERADVE